MWAKAFTRGKFNRGAMILTLLILSGLLISSPSLSAPKGEVVIGFFSPLTTDQLDPGRFRIVAYHNVVSAIHDALVKAMPGELYGKNLAESWTLSPDKLTYEFKLRKGVKFHNGDPVTAEDVQFSFNRYSGQGASLFKKKVREVQVVDDYTVRFHLTEPWSGFLNTIGGMASGAAYVVPKKYFLEVGEKGFLRKPIGAGPYKFVEFKPGEELVLEAFEGYWRKVPNVKRIVFKQIRNKSSRLAALKAGEVDYGMVFSGSLLEHIVKDPKLKVFSALPASSASLFFFDQWDPKSPFHDYRVRKAVSLAIDREEINKAVWLGYGRQIGNMIPPDMEYALPAKPDSYDPEGARALLKEAGYAPGSIEVEISPYPVSTQTGEMTAAYLEAIGIRAKIVSLEKAAFLSKWKSKKLRGMAFWHTFLPGTAATRMDIFVVPGGTYSIMPKGAVPEFEELARKQSKEVDEEKKTKLLHQMQQMVMDNLWVIPVLEFPICHGIGPRLEEPAVGLVPLMPFIGPYDDIRLKP